MQLIEQDAVTERVCIYEFLAGVFCSAPTAEGAHAVAQLALELGISCPDGLRVGELGREFMDLFVVPNPRYMAPYESVYRDRVALPPMPGKVVGEQASGRLLMGEATLQVRQAYLQAGVLPEEDLPDHIANELRFMAYTWARQAEAPPDEAPAWKELRESFGREHLLKWIGELRAKVAEGERLGFYRVALQIAEIVLREDSEWGGCLPRRGPLVNGRGPRR